MGTVVVTIGVGEGVGGALVGDGVSGKAPLSHHVPPNYDSEITFLEGHSIDHQTNKQILTSTSRHTAFTRFITPRPTLNNTIAIIPITIVSTRGARGRCWT